MNVAGYVRVSTSEQAVHGHSIEHQKAEIERYCKYKNHNIIAIYCDAGKSGGDVKKRPQFQAMLEDCKEGQIEAIIVHKIDRFSRNLLDIVFTLDDLNKQKIIFVSIVEGIDTSTSYGEFVIKILGVLAENERKKTIERITDIQLHLIKKGVLLNKPPYGYYKDKKTKVLYINEKEAEVVKKVFYYRSKEYDFDKISALTGLPLFKIKRILKNPFYIGKVVYKRIEYDGLHKPIIDKLTFNMVNSVI